MKKVLSLLLALTLMVGMLSNAGFSLAAKAESFGGSSIETPDAGVPEKNSLVVDKTAVYDENSGEYTITLEAYATGSKVITSADAEVPTDIVLVLDLSSSMSQNNMNTTTYTAYSDSDTQNTKLFAKRHNGGQSNLWYQVDGKYYSVSVNAQVSYTKLNTNGWKNYSTTGDGPNKQISSNCWYYYKNNLYVKIGESYNQVTVERDERKQSDKRTYTYTYTYTDANGQRKVATSTGDQGSPSFDAGLEFYTPSAEDANTVYTYTYTVNGVTNTICTSTGKTATVSDYTFYWKGTSNSNTTRLAALKTAVNGFVDSVYAKAIGSDNTAGTDDDVQHRIAIVGFNTNSTAYTKNNSGNLAFVNMNTNGVNATLINTVNKLNTGTGTKPAEGVNAANNLFNSNPITENEQRNRIVILFTDGYPSTSGPSNFDTTLANETIFATHISKQTHGATVYTIAVLDDADPTADISSGTTLTGNTLNVNKYLHYASSNYPNATSMTQGGTLNANADPFNGGKSYYLVAADTDSLSMIFQNIASEVESGGSSTTLDSSTVIKDIVAPQFELPAGATASNITLQTASCTGVGADNEYTWSTPTTATGVTATISDDNVNVTGFNFSENWVGTETSNGATKYRGSKLVIKFNVKTKDGFLGGNDVYTNTSAGVYENANATEPVLTFPRPQVNVPIKDVTVTAADKNVYLLGDLTAEQIKSGATAKCGNVELKLDEENYGLESWRTDYVNITVTYADASGNTVTDLSNLKDDTTYTVTVTVSPKTTTPTSTKGETAVSKSGNGQGKINVFTPELTFKDSNVYYGDTAPTDYSKNNESAKTVWKHGETKSTDKGITMIGTAPTLDLTYTPDSTKISDGKINTKDDIEVDVTVKIGENDVTDKTKFEHTTCTDRTETLPEGKEFLLHVKTCSLTIEKKAGTGTTIGNDEYFVFNVKKDGATYTQVTIPGTGSVTISELPVGSYTVEEDESTAWRYTPSITGSGNLSATNPTGSFTCTNTIKNKKWLNHFNQVINTFGTTN